MIDNSGDFVIIYKSGTANIRIALSESDRKAIGSRRKYG